MKTLTPCLPEPTTNPPDPAAAGSGFPPVRDRTSTAPPLIQSRDLLQGHGLVHIVHQGAVYRLQTTRQGKLILTK